jgi:hypothetical protein
MDGIVDLRDVIVLNKYMAKVISLSDMALKNADCCMDGNVDDQDSSILLQFVMLLVPDLPVATS